MSLKKIHVDRDVSGEEILERLDITPGRPVAILMGGASKLSPTDADYLQKQITEGMAQAIVEVGAIVVDGGTDSGVMGMLNTSLAAKNFTGPYIGVAPSVPDTPEGFVTLPGETWGETVFALGNHHSHIVEVDGTRFGDELIAMYALIKTLAQGNPSVGVLANGGIGAQNEVAQNVIQNREVIILSGSGRLADKISLTLRMPQMNHDPDIAKMVEDGRFATFNIDQPPKNFSKMMVEKLSL